MFSYELPIIASEDPYPAYRWLRDHDPAHYSEPEDVWVLSRYADCAEAFFDHETWSSERRGNLLNDLSDRVGKTLGTTDPPRHTWARKLVRLAFTPRTVKRLEPVIRSLANRLAADLSKGPAEFVGDFSAPFNASVLGEMFGVPAEGFLQLRHWLDDFFKRDTSKEGEEPPQVVAMRELRAYLGTLADRRLAEGSDDLMSAMLRADDGEHRLERDQVLVTTMTFLTAGFESTNNLLTNLVQALALFPEVREEVERDRSLIPALVEEGMRWDAPAQGFVRTPTRDVELHGKIIPEGAQVLLHIGSANRDERTFADPDRFDVHRDAQRHLGLGHGVHFCVGAPLGRLMTQVVFDELLSVSEHWQVDLSSAMRVTTPNFRGFSRLPFRL